MRTFLSTLLIWWLVCGPAFAETRYASPSGNDATGNGTIGNPYQTIGKLTSVSTSGDIMLLRAGTYAESISLTGSTLSGLNGQPSAYTILAAYNNEAVTVEPSTAASAFNFGDSSIFPYYWCLSNFVVNGTNLGNGPSALKMTSGGSNILQSLVFSNCSDNAILLSQQGGSDFAKVPHNYTLRSNQFYNTGWAWAPGENFPHDNYIQTRDSTIEYCRGWGAGSSDNDSEINFIKMGRGSTGTWITNNTIRYNYASNYIRTISDMGGYNKYYDNIFVSNRVWGIGILYNLSTNGLYANNTIDGTAWGFYSTSATLAGDNAQLVNNIVINFTQYGILNRGSTGTDWYTTNNLVYSSLVSDSQDISTVGGSGGTIVQSGNITGTGPDAQLTGQFKEPGSGGSGRNAGINLPALPDVDFDGTNRDEEGTTDIGAQEFPAAAPNVTVSIAATDAVASEADLDTGTFTVTRNGSTSGALTVNFALTGSTATSAVDYSSIGTSVVIGDGNATATITVTPLQDASIEGDETVKVTISADAAYTVGSPDNATVTIRDNDGQPSVVLRGN